MPETPWTGDIVSLVDAFRSGERHPTEELAATFAAGPARPAGGGRAAAGAQEEVGFHATFAASPHPDLLRCGRRVRG